VLRGAEAVEAADRGLATPGQGPEPPTYLLQARPVTIPRTTDTPDPPSTRPAACR
jgi:hypothetical protein